MKEEKGVMLCEKCKFNIPDTVKFCPKCGTKIEIIDVIFCPKCRVPNSLTAKFCKNDGTPLSKEVELQPVITEKKKPQKVLLATTKNLPLRIVLFASITILVSVGSYLYFFKESKDIKEKTPALLLDTKQTEKLEASLNNIKEKEKEKESSSFLNTAEFLYPNSDKRYLTESDLNGRTPWELTIMRNEIYARHGLPFKRKDLQHYFNKKSWYRIDPNYTDSKLNKYERQNSLFIREYQKRYGKMD